MKVISKKRLQGGKMNTQQLLTIGITFMVLTTNASISRAQENWILIAKKIQPSVVVVLSYDSEGKTLRRGAGFFVTPNGDVVTKRDLLEGIHHADIRTGDNMLYPIRKVLAEDREADLVRVAVEIPTSAVHPLSITRSLPHLGEGILAITPASLGGKGFSYGIVSGLREAPGFGRMIQVVLHEPTLTSRVEGRPVVNLKGNVVGVVVTKKLERKTLYFVLPGDRLVDILPGGAIPGVLSGKGKALSEWEVERRGAAEKLYAEGLPYYWKGDCGKALPYFKEAVQKDPRDFKAYFQIGYCQAELGHYQEAIQAYQQSIQIKPDFILPHFYVALAYMDLGDRESALKEYKIMKGMGKTGHVDRDYASDFAQMIGQ
jgi:hypothetical protein